MARRRCAVLCCARCVHECGVFVLYHRIVARFFGISGNSLSNFLGWMDVLDVNF